MAETVTVIKKKRELTVKTKRRIFVYGFIAWPLLHFFVFWLCMNIGTLTDSFFTYSIEGTKAFNGLENYKEIIKIILGQKDRGIFNHHAVLNSLSLIPLSLFINLPLTVLFAYSIFKKVLGHKFFRIVLFLPAVVSSVVLCLMFRLALDNGTGVVVQFLRMLGLAGDGTQANTGIIPVGGFLGNEDTVWPTILVFSVWTGVNGNLIYFTSAMSRMPQSIFESAEIDGASEVRQFISIALPLVWPTITTMSITLVAAVFSWLMPSLLLTDGADRATTIGMMITVGIRNDSSNTVLNAFGVLVAIFGAAFIMAFRWLMGKITEEVEY